MRANSLVATEGASAVSQRLPGSGRDVLGRGVFEEVAGRPGLDGFDDVGGGVEVDEDQHCGWVRQQP